MGQAAYNTTIKVSGTPVAFLDEPTTLVAGTAYQIDDPIKRVWDRKGVTIVEDSGTLLDSSEYTINYLIGVVVLENAPSGPVTVTGMYVPVMSVAGANQYSLDVTGDILDASNFSDAQGNGGFRSKEYGLTDVSVTISRFDNFNNRFKTALENRENMLIEVKPGNSTEFAKGWFILETAGSQGEFNALEMESLTFQLDGDLNSSFMWE